MTGRFVVATVRPWHLSAFSERISKLPGDWHLCSSPEDLTLDRLEAIKPDLIFVPHWNWMIPQEIIDSYEVIGFHPSDLPFGRGGSPVQNLIERGVYHSKLSAFRITKEMDAGPIYLKRDLSLRGRAIDVFHRIADLTAEMIETIIRDRPKPVPQTGQPTVFRRRKPDESALPVFVPLDQVREFIDMLDAPEYPKAFLNIGLLRMEFDNATLADGVLTATVRITEKAK